ncbi:hypothetical protein Pla110_00190 [Polystyrenella longa]|uniref:Uncharacterized protein n=1 Tax=Polystyrenella longa TaxID=2528007 RepID=A0A518CGG1_9PLAN|nr:hypothetical protein [Polystyrenella longa]QDU78318.1 hypothetical protein Pla110_00190 [Polystyrenella longa]
MEIPHLQIAFAGLLLLGLVGYTIYYRALIRNEGPLLATTLSPQRSLSNTRRIQIVLIASTLIGITAYMRLEGSRGYQLPAFPGVFLFLLVFGNSFRTPSMLILRNGVYVYSTPLARRYYPWTDLKTINWVPGNENKLELTTTQSKCITVPIDPTQREFINSLLNEQFAKVVPPIESSQNES